MRTENENTMLMETCEETDIGVRITNDLKHEKQVMAASQRAMMVVGRPTSLSKQGHLFDFRPT